MQKRWDIFCKVVDNFGDIGICWRLAQQLDTEHGLQIRLFVDNLNSAQKIIPSLNLKSNQQVINNIAIEKWHENTDFSQAADVVIETFACDLPPAYLAAMAQKKSKWVNLEYLSAEAWVDDFHAKPSPKPDGLIRYFYFPGFTEKTGGLIREVGIAAQLQNAINPRPRVGEGARQRGRGALGVNLDVAPLSNLSPASGREAFIDDTLKISLFCYPNAPIKDLFTTLQANSHAVSVYVPESGILPQIADYFGVETIGVGDYFTRENLHVHILPFLSQAEYDALLRDCDLNFVRGEDSWIRAIWAGKPFIWQPYFQDENTHMKKLKAFIDLFYANYEQKQLLWKAHECWAAEHASGCDAKTIWQNYINQMQAIQTYTKLQSKVLTAQADLAAKLVIFCNNL